MMEVIIVIAIIGILVGAGLPTYHRMQVQARSAHCLSNLHQIGVAVNALREAS